LGSIVQKGKFAACAFALLSALNRVDFPTFGNPTMPACNAIVLILRGKDSANDAIRASFVGITFKAITDQWH
jgi:hypothetical protein